MTPTAPRPHLKPGSGRWHRPALFVLAACASAALVACGGGGGGTASVGTGGTGSFAVGSINGLGSIYVNGVRFNTANAQISNANSPAQTVPDLGMTVEVRGQILPGGTSTAATVVIASEFKGPITSVDVANNRLVIFGRTVQITPATIFFDRANLSQLAAGNVVEIYGLPQPDGTLRATRIEFEAVNVTEFQAQPGNESFHVEGLLTNLAGTTPTRIFQVAGVRFREVVDHALPANLANNTEVTVAFAPTTDAQPFDAVTVRVESRSFADGVRHAEIEGLISDPRVTTDGATTFRLNGFEVRVPASGVTFEFDGPTQPALAVNVRVEVYGHIDNGVLVATKVEFEDEDTDRDAFEFAGVATCASAACTPVSGSFTLTLAGGRTLTIGYDADTEFDRGLTFANLHNQRVEIDAEAPNGGGGDSFFATWIGLDD